MRTARSMRGGSSQAYCKKRRSCLTPTLRATVPLHLERLHSHHRTNAEISAQSRGSLDAAVGMLHARARRAGWIFDGVERVLVAERAAQKKYALPFFSKELWLRQGLTF
jgi:hypothetical protein